MIQIILESLQNEETVDSMALASTHKVDHQNVVVKALKTLEAAEYVLSDMKSFDILGVTAEAAGICDKGCSPEFEFYSSLTEEGVETADLKAKLGPQTFGIGMGPCMKNKWAKKKGSLIMRAAPAEKVQDSTLALLRDVSQGKPISAADEKGLARRKLVMKKKGNVFMIRKHASFRPIYVKQEAALTKEMLVSGAWKQPGHIRPVNLNALGAPVEGGYFHPLLKVRAEFRKILISMGFTEMPTNRWVESSFWNFDALFQPQSHPARDAHDTFFIKEPASTVRVPEDYYEKVKAMHEKGGHGSIGYRYDFKREEAFKNLLRTHTTAISSQMLYKLANQEGGFKPMKYFSIDRVFRNESMDMTHLCEFHQVEGLVADYRLSLKDLIGMIKTFFEAIGITKLRFKPAFNPYTEPSMEIFGWMELHQKWSEIGNSGMFRPEMLAPMGLPKDVRVIAWGLSLERPTMIKYGINNIRDLFGHKCDIKATRDAPLAIFD